MITKVTEFIKNINNPNPLFIDIILKRAELSPQKNAYSILSNGNEQLVSYSELRERIQNLAAYLQKKNLKGERALLLYPHGLDYIVGFYACLFSGVIAVPAYPPDSSRMAKTLPRLEAIAEDAQAKIVLSTQEIKSQVFSWKEKLLSDNEEIVEKLPKAEFIGRLNAILETEWLATDNHLDFNLSDEWEYPNIDADDIAYLQYTSGSTGTPKGVMISHNNLIHNTMSIYDGFALHRGEFEGVLWLPIYHDMGLIGGVVSPVFFGYTCTLFSPIDFLKRPLRWLQIISDKKDVEIVSGGPNFAYDLCIRGTNEQKRATLDLSNWRLAFSGAEPVRAETVNNFTKAFEIAGFKRTAFNPCYGLAEATLMVSASKCDVEIVGNKFNKESLQQNIAKICNEDDKSIELISCGNKVLDGEIKIVNPESHNTCDDGIVGEIWSKSRSNAKGYWKKPELSAEIFNAFTSDTNEGPFLRTGDLGFILNDNLYITGRLKDLIIIRGSNHYPQDIELTVDNSSSMVRPGSTAVFSIEEQNDEHLIVVAEARAKKDVNWDSVCEEIKIAILENHSILTSQIVLIKPKTIFKTSSGKIRRNDTKKAFLRNSLEIIYHWSNNGKVFESEKELKEEKNNSNTFAIKNDIPREKIVELFVDRLSTELKLPKNKIDKDAPFTNFGLDSAKSVQLIGQLEDLVGQNLEPTLLWNYPTINKLSDYISGAGEKTKISADGDKESVHLNVEEVEKLSDEEAEKLLLNKLNSDDLGI